MPEHHEQVTELELEGMPSFLLNHIVHQYHQILQSRLRSVGVSTLKMRVIISLRIYGQLTVSELCSYAIAEQPTMSRALESLDKQGFVERQVGAEDSRLRLVSLTDAGRRIFERIEPEISQLNDSMTAGLPPEERTAFLGALRHVLGNLRNVAAASAR
ncbi:winged helix-turn-helix transcriptional regulator [Paracoccus aurantiacus]|uniref:Winged helix-turn-helix transcriptional regulator n=1 Tax=Paracoccus aurantiacus TaxID=2599412 RepID=A0A5C6S051_9RHOB|nr:MarR family winged helix-turn-helix transcriptional regulator [Paracoccus aurantiacus]TXB67733.1 winged helix-turn-helix transcriptional regulator [Paracoccus aurantiacus]